MQARRIFFVPSVPRTLLVSSARVQIRVFQKRSVAMSRFAVRLKKILTLLSLPCLLTAVTSPFSHAQDRAGAVYVMTNQVANSVQVFLRAPDGTLTPGGMFLTGGAGAPTGNLFGNPNDPLASQGSVTLSSDNHFLFVVNAGSAEISVFSVEQSGL